MGRKENRFQAYLKDLGGDGKGQAEWVLYPFGLGRHRGVRQVRYSGSDTPEVVVDETIAPKRGFFTTIGQVCRAEIYQLRQRGRGGLVPHGVMEDPLRVPQDLEDVLSGLGTLFVQQSSQPRVRTRIVVSSTDITVRQRRGKEDKVVRPGRVIRRGDPQ